MSEIKPIPEEEEKPREKKKRHLRIRRPVHHLIRLAVLALFIALCICFRPQIGKFLSAFYNALTCPAVTASVTLSEKMTASSRLETDRYEKTGQVTGEVKALLLGTVSSVTSDYTYSAGIGIDLTKIRYETDGRTLTLYLPAPEVLYDSLTPGTITRQGYPELFDDNKVQAMFDQEAAACRTALEESMAADDSTREDALTALKSSVGTWLGAEGILVEVRYVWQDEAEVPETAVSLAGAE